MAINTPGTFASFPSYQPGALTYTGSEILLLVTSTSATSAITNFDYVTNIVGKAPSVMTVANPATADLIAFFQSASNLPYACQVGDLGIPAGNVPTGGGTGTILNKISGVNFNAGWSTIAQFVSVGTGLATSGSATALVLAVTGPLTPTTYTANGVLYGNGTGALGVTNFGTTAYALTGNGSASAPTFAILTVPGGGIGTTALSSHGIPTAQGSSAFGVAAATTAGYPFVSNGSTTDPSFQALPLNTTNVTSQLPVTFGGIGTSTLSSHGVALAQGSAAFGVAAATTAGYPLIANGSTSDPSFKSLALNTANVTSQLPVTFGGIGTSTLSSHGVAVAQGSAAFQTVNATTTGLVLQSQGSTNDPAFVTLSAAAFATTTPPYGLSAPVNLGLSASISSGTLTINFLNNAGSAPSAASPILVGFQNTNATTATPAWSTINSALSITTFSTGATLGASNSSVPFRFWINLFYQNATQVMPALINCSNAGQIFALADNQSATTVGIGSTAITAGIFYSPNGTSVGNAPYRTVGYVEYGGGLPTAGSYSTAPTALKVYSLGMKKPGDTVQIVALQTSTIATATFTTVLATTNVSASIAPTSAVNLVSYMMSVSAANNTTGGGNVNGQIYRAGNAIGALIGTLPSNVAARRGELVTMGLDSPATTVLTNYVLECTTATGTGNVPSVNTDGGVLLLTEIMG